jgi:hypothetical protein
MTNRMITSLTELESRLENASLQLQGLRDEAIREDTKSRLSGKIEGVHLALSYIHETLRAEEANKIRIKPSPRPSRGW